MAPKKDSDSTLVYSTEDATPPGRGRKSNKNSNQQIKLNSKSKQKKDGIVRVGRETKGRKGKGVTIITGVPLIQDELRKLTQQLKQMCGSGGTVKEGIIEIQGDHRDRIIEELTKHGYQVKRSGG